MNRSRMLQGLFISEVNNAFQILVKTDNAGTSNNDQFTIPTRSSEYTYNYDVDWGDGNTSSGLTGDATHTYASGGEYTIKITGTFPTIYFSNGGDKDKLLEIQNWGNIEWQLFFRSFYGCTNMTSVDDGVINTSSVTDMSYMFYGCTSLTTLDVSGFNTSQFTNMGRMFVNCSSLTSVDFTGLNTSSVTDMRDMFYGCTSLTSVDFTGFDTSSVIYMGGMFRDCSSFISVDVSGFDTSNVTDMRGMFRDCSLLTSVDVSGFDTSSVTDMWTMFYNCPSLTSFDPSGFIITSVTNLGYFAMFTNMGTTNYDNLLVNWEAQLVNDNLSPDFGNAQYTAGSPAETARQALITNHNWSITDGGSV